MIIFYSTNCRILNREIFFSFCDERKENESKEKKLRTVFYNLTVVVQMDIVGKLKLLRSLKNARGAIVV